MSYVYNAGFGRISTCFAITALLFLPLILSYLFASKCNAVESEQVKAKQQKLNAYLRRIRNIIVILNSVTMGIATVKGCSTAEEGPSMAILAGCLIIVFSDAMILLINKIIETIANNAVLIFAETLDDKQTIAENSLEGIRRSQHERFVKYVEDRNNGTVVEPPRPQLNRRQTFPSTAPITTPKRNIAASEIGRKPSPFNQPRVQTEDDQKIKPVDNTARKHRPVRTHAEKRPVPAATGKKMSAQAIAEEENVIPLNETPQPSVDNGQISGVSDFKLGTFDLDANSFDQFVSSDWDQ